MWDGALRLMGDDPEWMAPPMSAALRAVIRQVLGAAKSCYGVEGKRHTAVGAA